MVVVVEVEVVEYYRNQISNGVNSKVELMAVIYLYSIYQLIGLLEIYNYTLVTLVIWSVPELWLIEKLADPKDLASLAMMIQKVLTEP